MKWILIASVCATCLSYLGEYNNKLACDSAAVVSEYELIDNPDKDFRYRCVQKGKIPDDDHPLRAN